MRRKEVMRQQIQSVNAEYEGLKKGLNANDVGRNVSSSVLSSSLLVLCCVAVYGWCVYEGLKKGLNANDVGRNVSSSVLSSSLLVLCCVALYGWCVYEGLKKGLNANDDAM
jgi:ABC-type transporter Mla maintaining outer membrane lipid asymmetry permease subunit MlaE